MNIKIKLKKGDEVIVLAGKDKGKVGKISLIKPQINKAIVSGINKVKKHTKPDNNQAGGIVEKEMPIQISNLAFYDNIEKKGVRLGYKFNDKKLKIRINKNSGKEI
jgi:large subunit ribosomal protein L24